ncbi:MAG: RNA-guided pseudouridylation complex pseudouridine synthase subunit Cbf5 [Candidatus Aenigmarchaeota archaeon]|nr:RNA-guided pseudouridylation complex pseudouridine synthase subunit Cbf5 [Candidatus Aenigmarchaeota archaeon]
MEDSDWIVKSADEPARGRKPEERSVEELLANGIVILDKWQGPTSHDAVATVKKVLGLKKVGHAGTLDPAVSGVLPLTLESACKAIPALQKVDKEYVGIMHTHKDVDEAALRGIMQAFTGTIRQLPPVRSAVARKERQRRVHAFELLELKGRDALFRIECEAGTYVRKIVHDVGRQIGGAHMQELRRTRAGPFAEDAAVKMHDLADAYLQWKQDGDERIRKYVLPVEAAASHLGKIIVKDSAVRSLTNGSPLYISGASRVQKGIRQGDLVALVTLKGELVALGRAEADSERMTKSRIAKTDRVVMIQKTAA